MEREPAELKKELIQVKRRVTRVERHIKSQRCIIADLKRYGRDSRSSEKRLAALLELQIGSIADRDRLQNALAEVDRLADKFRRSGDGERTEPFN